jgi:protein SCO1
MRELGQTVTGEACSVSRRKIPGRRSSPFARHLISAALILSVVFSSRPVPAQATLPPEGSNVSFALTAADGTSVTEQTYRGKWLVIYFGYTFCPDICPTTMMDIAGALDMLGPRANKVQGLFITVDPKRDTPSVLTDYLKSFDPHLVGLTGTPAQIAHAAKSFHVFYERQDNDSGGYSYDHSAFIYFVDPSGRFAQATSDEGGSKQLADALYSLMTDTR